MAKHEVSRSSPTSRDVDDLALFKEEESSQTDRAALDGIVWKKLDRWVLPLLTTFTLLSAVDRTNIANVRVAGLQNSLAMTNYQYTMALTVTYVSDIAAQLPFTLLLKYVGSDLMLPAIVTLWGVVSATQDEQLLQSSRYRKFAHKRLRSGQQPFPVARVSILPGVVSRSGGHAPGMALYLSFFYPRNRLQIRIAALYASAALAGAFSGLLAAAIEQMNGKGGKPGWAWIFILEGIFTFVFGAISFFLLPRSPEKARFFTEKERVYVVSTLKHAGSVAEDDDKDRFSWREVIRSAKSPHVWLLTVASFLNGATLLGLAYFEPSIIASLGYAGTEAQLMSVPPFAVVFALSFTSAVVSDHYRCRGYTAIFFSLFQVIGFTMFYASTSSYVRYASLFFSVNGAGNTQQAVLTWLANNSAPHTRRAAALAVGAIMTNLGGMLAIWLLGSLSPAPNYTSATITFIVMSIGMVVLLAANLVYLSRENWLKAEKRQRMKKEDEPEGLGDRSAWFIYSL